MSLFNETVWNRVLSAVGSVHEDDKQIKMYLHWQYTGPHKYLTSNASQYVTFTNVQTGASVASFKLGVKQTHDRREAEGCAAAWRSSSNSKSVKIKL